MKLNNIFVCPVCKGYLSKTDKFYCKNCNKYYLIKNEIPIFLNNFSNNKDIFEYWNNGWKKRVRDAHGDHNFLLKYNKHDFLSYIEKQIQELKKNDHILVYKKSPNYLKYKKTLNIGCGGGLEGPILSYFGADYTGIDISFSGPEIVKKYLDILEFNGRVAQMDAENLAFENNSFDYIYSNGVLHHTPNTLKTLDEVYRVLKPGGTAVIGLYYTYSLQFIYAKIYGTVKGVFSGSKWYQYGELDWKTDELSNPWTKTYSKKELKEIFNKYKYKKIWIRNFGNAFAAVPRFSKYLLKIKLLNNLGKILSSQFGSMIVAFLVK